MTYIRIMLFSFLFVSNAYANELESRLIELIEKRKVDDLKSTIESIKQKYPNHAITYYVDAFLEEDGKLAYEKYLEFTTRFPNSPYINQAKLRLAQYYYAQGLYESAQRMLTDILKNTSSSDEKILDDVYYLLIQNFLALDELREAKIVMNEFLEKFRRSDYYKLVKEDDKWLKDKPELAKQDDDFVSRKGVSATKLPDGKATGFALQVGAFLDPENAERLHAKLEELGYPVKMKQRKIDNKLFFLVLVGSFSSREQALEYGSDILQKHGVNFRVVNE
ncbi:SPOR domain-containing protein [candidate division KSB1 bacterium]|nr:SPOR domain-containing protein [candidate division KSB1 bacterium]